MKKAFAYSLAAALCFAVPLSAETMSMGEFEYRNSCAVCHGEDGSGNGPLAGMMGVDPSDLTVMQRDNGGVFPVERTYKVIDGSADLRAHGRFDMPVWGARYLARVDNDPGYDYTPEERLAYSRNRILALIEYLSTIQAK